MLELQPVHTPQDVAKRYGVDVNKIVGWIRAGELRAINLALDRHGKRPRWRIRPEDLAAFENMRATHPQEPKPERRRRPALPPGPKWF